MIPWATLVKPISILISLIRIPDACSQAIQTVHNSKPKPVINIITHYFRHLQKKPKNIEFTVLSKYKRLHTTTSSVSSLTSNNWNIIKSNIKQLEYVLYKSVLFKTSNDVICMSNAKRSFPNPSLYVQKDHLWIRHYHQELLQLLSTNKIFYSYYFSCSEFSQNQLVW